MAAETTTTYKKRSPEQIVEAMSSNVVAEDSEESLYMRLLDLLDRYFSGTKEEKENVFIRAIDHIHFNAMQPSYREMLTASAEKIGPTALSTVQKKLENLSHDVVKTQRKYGKWSKDFYGELKPDSKKIEPNITLREMVKIWRGYRLTYSMNINDERSVQIFIKVDGPSAQIPPMSWKVRFDQYRFQAKKTEDSNIFQATIVKGNVEDFRYENLSNFNKGSKWILDGSFTE